jgi:hypothetical protein
MVYSLYANENTGHPIGQVFIGGEQNATGTATLSQNKWTYLAVTYDGATLRLYVNASQVAARTISATILKSTGVLHIGGDSVWSEWFKGLIDEVRVYNRPLSAGEIQTDMSTPVR